MAPDLVSFNIVEVPLAPPAVEVEERSRPVPVVSEFAMTAPALPVVDGAVTDKVPLETVRFPLVSTVRPATVEAALLSKPLVMVTAPEMVGVAVQAVPVTVKFPPREVRLLPETVKVLSRVVAPCKVKAPGVVTEPMVFIDEAPVPMVEFPDEVKVVKAPVLGVVEPIVPGATQVAPTKEEALIVPVPV